MFKRLPIDSFVLLMIAVVVLAALMPSLGASDGPLHLDVITEFGVALVFFFAGAGLSFANLAAGVTNWRLHLLVQLSTFVLFPAIGIGFMIVGRGWLPQGLLAGFFYLCALPSTISTSIALTTLARGNVAGAIFNATLSSLLGMVITPLLVNLWLRTGGEGMSGADMLDQFIKIATQLFLPLVAGQVARRWIAGWVGRNKALIAKSDRLVILLIVYSAFCDSTQAGIWKQYGLITLLQTALLSVALLAFALSITTLLARKLGYSKEDEITGVFCGSKKSLAVGIPMAKLLMGDTPLGLIVLPIMFYHQLQIMVCTVMAQRYAARDAAPAPLSTTA